jgi:hypothetical protein
MDILSQIVGAVFSEKGRDAHRMILLVLCVFTWKQSQSIDKRLAALEQRAGFPPAAAVAGFDTNKLALVHNPYE